MSSVVLPEGIQTIGSGAFEYCRALAEITIPGTVTAIDSWAFRNCTALAGACFWGNAPGLGSDVFYGSPATIYHLSGASGWPPVPDAWAGRPTALWAPNPPSLFSSVSILRRLDADGPALFEVDLSAPEGKTITLTVPTVPTTVYDVTEDEAGEYECFDNNVANLEAQYPQGDYELRLYSDAGKTILEETLMVSFGDGSGDPLPFPEEFASLTQPVPAGDQIHAVPEQTYTWDSYGGTAGTSTHMHLEITGTGEADEDIAEYDAEIDGSCSFTPPPDSVPHHWLDLHTLVLDGDYEAAAFSDADGDGHLAWEEYVASTDPNDPESVLRVHIHFENGLPVVTWHPDLGSDRSYHAEGRASLSAGDWEPASESHHFFRVRVDLP